MQSKSHEKLLRNKLRNMEKERENPSNVDNTSEKGPVISFLDMNIPQLIGNILNNHHPFMRRIIPRVRKALENAHIPQNKEYSSFLQGLQKVISTLENEMQQHFEFEETKLFPFLIKLDKDKTVFANPETAREIVEKLSILTKDHDEITEKIGEIFSESVKTIRQNKDIHHTMATLTELLDEMAQDITQHIYKENEILFPKAMGKPLPSQCKIMDKPEWDTCKIMDKPEWDTRKIIQALPHQYPDELNDIPGMGLIYPIQGIGEGHRFVNQMYFDMSDREAKIKVFTQNIALRRLLVGWLNKYHSDLKVKPETVEEIIIILGDQNTRYLFLAHAYNIMFPENTEKKGIFTKAGLWRHMLGVMETGLILCQRTQLSAPSRVFTSGFLHDLGYILMNSFWPNLMANLRNLVAEGKKTLIDCEKDLINGNNHADVGAWIGEIWDLPEELIYLIRNHHNPISKDMDEDLLILTVADYISTTYIVPSIPRPANNAPIPDLKGILGLNRGDIEKIANEAKAHIENSSLVLFPERVQEILRN